MVGSKVNFGSSFRMGYPLVMLYALLVQVGTVTPTIRTDTTSRLLEYTLPVGLRSDGRVYSALYVGLPSPLILSRSHC